MSQSYDIKFQRDILLKPLNDEPIGEIYRKKSGELIALVIIDSNLEKTAQFIGTSSLPNHKGYQIDIALIKVNKKAFIDYLVNDLPLLEGILIRELGFYYLEKFPEKINDFLKDELDEKIVTKLASIS